MKPTSISEKSLANLTPWKKGQSGNPAGRPKDTLKSYVREKFVKMSEEEREAFLKGVMPVDIWKMAEGNPKQEEEHSGEITIQKPIYGGVSKHNGNKEDIQSNEKD